MSIPSLNTVSVRDLEYIVAVAELRHFGKAAQRCHVSQPALSLQIKKLEDTLSINFFDRSNRQVNISPEAEPLIAQARTILHETRRFLELARAPKAPLSGPFRLGAIASLGPYLFPQILKPLRKAYPELVLIIREGLTDSLLEQLNRGELDAILASPTFETKGYRTATLFFEPFILAAPRNHPILEKRHVLGRDLKADQMVLLEDGHCLKDQTMEFCSQARARQASEYQATSVETLRQLVASGLGYTLMPKLAVPKNPPLSELVTYRAFEDERIGRDVILVAREQGSRARDFDALQALIKKEISLG